MNGIDWEVLSRLWRKDVIIWRGRFYLRTPLIEPCNLCGANSMNLYAILPFPLKLFILLVLFGGFDGRFRRPGVRSAEFLHIVKEIAYLLQEIILWGIELTSCFKSLYSTCTLWNLAWWSGRPCEALGVSRGLKFIYSRLCPNIPLSRSWVHILLSPFVPLHTYCRYHTKALNSRVLTQFTYSFVFRCSLSAWTFHILPKSSEGASILSNEHFASADICPSHGTKN